MWEDIARYLVSKGDVGVTILIAGLIIAYLQNGWRACEKGRLEEVKATIPVLKAAADAMADVTKEMASRTTMATSMGETMRGVLAAQEKIVERMEKLIDFVRESNLRGRP